MSRMSKTIAIRYVSDAGSDANDGLSWSTSKRTIYGALVSLPGGGTNMAGSGTIYVGPGCHCQSNGQWWNLADGAKRPELFLASCWLAEMCGMRLQLNIIGMCQCWRVDRTATSQESIWSLPVVLQTTIIPGIWISCYGNQNIYIANLQFATIARSIVLGECSNNDRDGTCGVQSIILDNVGRLECSDSD